jgi:multiple sugar transport system permease protein
MVSDHNGAKRLGNSPRSQRLRPAARVWQALWMIVLLSAAALFFVPLIWLLLAPTKSDEALVLVAPLSFGSLEQLGQTAQNLFTFNDGQILTWAKNSLLYCLSSVLLTLLVSVPAGYGLATTKFAARRTILILTLVTMVMPRVVLVLPIFLEMSAIGLVNNAWSVILASAFFPFGVYLLYIFFVTNLPRDILNAARIDGCNEYQLFSRIAVPLAGPAVALVAFFSFVATWNEYFLVGTLLNDDRLYNLPVGLATLMSVGSLNPGLMGNFSAVKRPEVALAGLVLVLPIIAVFIYTQRSVRADNLAGGEKG